MDKDINQSLLELILPEGILDYFTIVGFDKGNSGKYVYDKTLTIYLEEKNQIPTEYVYFPLTNRKKLNGIC